MTIDHYDVLSILGNNIISTTYKVKHKSTKKILVWKTIDCKNKTEAEKKAILEEIRKRSNICHPNIIKFDNYIEQENKIVYAMTEYCEYGSLNDIINSCSESNNRLSEELVSKILYQIAFAMKTIDNYTGDLTTKEIFLDGNLNVKLYNFKPEHKNKGLKMCSLGLLLYEICALKTFDKTKFEDELKCVENIYSNSILSLIKHLIKDKTELLKNVNKILCHPTILLKSTQCLKENIYIKNENSEKPPQSVSDIQEDFKVYTLKLEKLRKKEISLQIREQQFKDREHKLIMKEKKITLMEKTVKEKLQQAELYLKRCRESKSVSGEDTKSTTSDQIKKKSWENLDSTYVSCGDSIILPTSSKLNVNKIVKPAPFTRTLSERRIRFKGHSPLKEIDFNKKHIKQSKAQKGILLKKESEWLTCSEDTDKSSIEGSLKGTMKKSKQLFPERNTYENNDLSKPITWTEENKRYAFELLKMMNDNKENQCLEVKHTYL